MSDLKTASIGERIVEKIENHLASNDWKSNCGDQIAKIIDLKVAPLIEALRQASIDLTCPSANGTHYCPNCDNSLFNTKARIDAALANA